MATLEEKFALLVGMVQKDMESFKVAANKLQQMITAQGVEIAGLKAQLAQLGARPQAQTTVDGEIVGQHPITGAPITRADIEKDPKLKLRLAFSENDA